jgi:hypothetical protein
VAGVYIQDISSLVEPVGAYPLRQAKLILPKLSIAVKKKKKKDQQQHQKQAQYPL